MTLHAKVGLNFLRLRQILKNPKPTGRRPEINCPEVCETIRVSEGTEQKILNKYLEARKTCARSLMHWQSPKNRLVSNFLPNVWWIQWRGLRSRCWKHCHSYETLLYTETMTWNMTLKPKTRAANASLMEKKVRRGKTAASVMVTIFFSRNHDCAIRWRWNGDYQMPFSAISEEICHKKFAHWVGKFSLLQFPCFMQWS